MVDEGSEFFDEEYRPCLYTPQTKYVMPKDESPLSSEKQSGKSRSSGVPYQPAETPHESVTSGALGFKRNQHHEESYTHNRDGSIRKDEQLKDSHGLDHDTSFFIHPDNTYLTGLQRFIRKYTENWRKRK